MRLPLIGMPMNMLDWVMPVAGERPSMCSWLRGLPVSEATAYHRQCLHSGLASSDCRCRQLSSWPLKAC